MFSSGKLPPGGETIIAAIDEKSLEVKPDDAPSQLYINRCEELKKNSVFTMTRK